VIEIVDPGDQQDRHEHLLGEERGALVLEAHHGGDEMASRSRAGEHVAAGQHLPPSSRALDITLERGHRALGDQRAEKDLAPQRIADGERRGRREQPAVNASRTASST
jgi:hypothetical protein